MRFVLLGFETCDWLRKSELTAPKHKIFSLPTSLQSDCIADPGSEPYFPNILICSSRCLGGRSRQFY